MPQTKSTNQNPELPDNLNELFARIYAFLRSLFGSTIAAIVVGALVILALVVLSIVLRV